MDNLDFFATTMVFVGGGLLLVCVRAAMRSGTEQYEAEESAIRSAARTTMMANCEHFPCRHRDCELGCPDFADARRHELTKEPTVVIDRRKRRLQCIAS